MLFFYVNRYYFCWSKMFENTGLIEMNNRSNIQYLNGVCNGDNMKKQVAKGV